MKRNAKNRVGPQIRRIRYQKQMTQETLAARCNRLGWDISRGTLAKIEAQVRCISDTEIEILGKALSVTLDELFK